MQEDLSDGKNKQSYLMGGKTKRKKKNKNENKINLNRNLSNFIYE